LISESVAISSESVRQTLDRFVEGLQASFFQSDCPLTGGRMQGRNTGTPQSG
jgi:hypothetical protein